MTSAPDWLDAPNAWLCSGGLPLAAFEEVSPDAVLVDTDAADALVETLRHAFPYVEILPKRRGEERLISLAGDGWRVLRILADGASAAHAAGALARVKIPFAVIGFADVAPPQDGHTRPRPSATTSLAGVAG